MWRMVRNRNLILGGEAICAAQGVGLRAPLSTSPPCKPPSAPCGPWPPALENDRCLAPDLARAAGLVTDGRLSGATGVALPDPTLFSV